MKSFFAVVSSYSKDREAGTLDLKQSRCFLSVAVRCSVFGLLSAAIAAGCVQAQRTDWRPERAVEIIIGASPGGSGDATGRVLQRVWREKSLVAVPTTVVNKPGASGTVSRVYLNQYAGDGHYVAITPLTIVTNYITGISSLTISDFTPIAHLYNEYIAVATRVDSPLKTARDLVDQLRSDAPITIGFGASRGSANHIAIGLITRAAGADAKRLKTVVFNSAGNAVAALLGGHVDVVPASAAVLVPHLVSGRVRILGITAPRRLGGGLSSVPTLLEGGVNAVFSNWRGVLGPKGLGAEQVTYWERVFAGTAQSEEWNRDLSTNFWSNAYMASSEARRFWEAQQKELRPVLTDLGLAKARQ